MDESRSRRPFRTIEISDSGFAVDNLRFVTVKSQALGRRADILVFVPPETRGCADVPLTVLLHGVYGSHWSWALQGGACETAARLIAAGEIPPMVLVMPSDGLFGDGGGYLDGPGGNGEAWIVTEVPAAAGLAVSCVTDRSPRFIGGLSMGGWGALRLAAKFPEHYKAASAHSAITELEEFLGFIEEKSAFASVCSEEVSLLHVLVAARSRLPPLRFDCGVDDPLVGGNRRLHEALTREGIPHEYSEYPGGHCWAYWQEHLVETLKFFGGSVVG